EIDPCRSGRQSARKAAGKTIRRLPLRARPARRARVGRMLSNRGGGRYVLMRSILIICSCACVAVVLTEVAGLAYLWQQGNLTSDNIRDVRQILTGVVAAEKKEADEAQAGVPLV